jgi:hypothetical protein
MLTAVITQVLEEIWESTIDCGWQAIRSMQASFVSLRKFDVSDVLQQVQIKEPRSGALLYR